VRALKLGHPNGVAAPRRAGKGGVALRETVAANANDFARELAPVISEVRTRGITSVRGIADEPDRRSMQARRGGTWHVSNTRNLLARVETVGDVSTDGPLSGH